MMDFTGIYLLLGVLGLIALGLVALYFLRAYALYQLARTAGMQNPGLAWVPIANQYILGCLCDRAAYYRTGGRWHFNVILPVVGTLGSPFFFYFALEYGYDFAFSAMDYTAITGLQSLLGFAAWVLSTLALYNLFWDYAPGQEGVYTIVSALFAAVAPAILLFLIRKNIPFSVSGGRPVPPPAYTTYTTGPGDLRPPPPPPPSPQGPPWDGGNSWQP
ncbi:MAG: hypothetical protein HFF14_00645 [Angelakisella sp.]|jgi:hypothetical protein|nr:hypothetical protein [Angelakisella sp.]